MDKVQASFGDVGEKLTLAHSHAQEASLSSSLWEHSSQLFHILLLYLFHKRLFLVHSSPIACEHTRTHAAVAQSQEGGQMRVGRERSSNLLPCFICAPLPNRIPTATGPTPSAK